jgi:hypothetical protein
MRRGVMHKRVVCFSGYGPESRREIECHRAPIAKHSQLPRFLLAVPEMDTLNVSYKVPFLK